MTASTESWEHHPCARRRRGACARRRAPPAPARARPTRGCGTGLGAELVLAADQFIISPHVRPRDEARLRAEGDEARTVIAGYHWFTDWGRDTMISLEGLTLLTGRHRRGARHPAHLRASHPRRPDPQPVPRGEERGPLSHGRRDALVLPRARSLRAATGDARRAGSCCRSWSRSSRSTSPARASASASIRRDGLLRQGAAGYQLTWMDAKVGDWVVTPRRGKAVEINALFYNALWLLARLARRTKRRLGPPRAACAARRRCRRRAPALRRRSTGASGTRRRTVSTTSSTARTAPRRRRRCQHAAQPVARDLAAAPGARAARWEPVLERGAREAGDAVRPALAGARATPTTSRATTAICARATPPITRGRCGAG